MKISIFKPLYFLKWRPIFDDFYSTDHKTQKLFKGLVFGFGPKWRLGRMCNSVRYKCGHTKISIYFGEYRFVSFLQLSIYLVLDSPSCWNSTLQDFELLGVKSGLAKWCSNDRLSNIWPKYILLSSLKFSSSQLRAGCRQTNKSDNLM